MDKRGEKFEREALAPFSKAARITSRTTKASADGDFRTVDMGMRGPRACGSRLTGAPSQGFGRR